MSEWFKIASFVITTTVAAAVVVAGIVHEIRRRQNDERVVLTNFQFDEHRRPPSNNDNQNHGSRDPTEESSREDERKRSALRREQLLAKLREERRKQLQDERKQIEEEKRKKEEEDRRRKEEDRRKKEEDRRKKEEEERQENEKKKSMLDSFDDVFDAEVGVKTRVESVDGDFDDWASNVHKQKLKQEFRAKQMARHQKSQDEKEIMIGERTDELKIEQQKTIVSKCAIDKRFELRELILRAIVNVNTDNNVTLALSLRAIKKNKRRKVIDLQELKSAVYSFQEISQENEPLKNSVFPENLKKKAKKKKKGKQVAAQQPTKQFREQLVVVTCSENKSSIPVRKQLEETQTRKLEVEKKQREDALATWKLRRKLRQQANECSINRRFQNYRSIPLQKQLLENKKIKGKLEVNGRKAAGKIHSKPNFSDDKIVYQDFYNCNRSNTLNISNLQNQLSELMFQTKYLAQNQKSQYEKENIKINAKIDKLKIEKQMPTTSNYVANERFKCSKIMLRLIINVNMRDDDTLVASLRGIGKNKRKKVIDLEELENAVDSLKDILQEGGQQEEPLLAAHTVPENVNKKVKKKNRKKK